MSSISRLSLRARIVISYALFSVLLSVVFAGGVYIAFDALEDDFVGDTVSSELDEFIAAGGGKTHTGLVSSHMHIYVSGTPSWAALPEDFAGLPAGITEMAIGDREYHIEVRDLDGRRFVMAFDETEIEERQEKLGVVLLAGVLACTYAGVWAGFVVSRRVIEPVTRLSREVQALLGGDVDAALAANYARDEVGGLAESFRRYQQQLQEFLHREREFTGTVSHELRTPLTVIGNNADVLLNDPSLSGTQRARLERMRRGVQECAELVGTFLAMARNRHVLDGSCDPRSVIEQLARNTQEQFGVEPRIETAADAPATLPMPAAPLGVMLRNLVNNAVEHGRPPVVVRLDAGCVSVRNSGTAELPYSDADGRLGLAIVRRLCERQGWQLQVEKETDQTVVKVIFSS